MTIKRGADGSAPPGTRARDVTAPRDTVKPGEAQKTNSPEPRSVVVDGFDNAAQADTRVTGSGSTAVDELLSEARERPSLVSSMNRVLDDTKKKLEAEIASLREEAARISSDTALPLDQKIGALADVRARLAKPRRRLVSLRRRARTLSVVAARDHDGAMKRGRAALARADAATAPADRALALASVVAEMKLPTDASAAAGVVRLDVEGLADRAALATRLAHDAPSLGDARALLALLTGVEVADEASAQSRSNASGALDVIARLREARSS